MLDLILSHENIWSDNIQVNKRKLQATCTTHIMLYALVAQSLTFLFDVFSGANFAWIFIVKW